MLSRQLIYSSEDPEYLFFVHLNVNIIRNKFPSIQELIKKTKIDDSFSNAQFKIKGYKSFRKDEMPLEEDFSFTFTIRI